MQPRSTKFGSLQGPQRHRLRFGWGRERTSRHTEHLAYCKNDPGMESRFREQWTNHSGLGLRRLQQQCRIACRSQIPSQIQRRDQSMSNVPSSCGYSRALPRCPLSYAPFLIRAAPIADHKGNLERGSRVRGHLQNIIGLTCVQELRRSRSPVADTGSCSSRRTEAVEAGSWSIGEWRWGTSETLRPGA